MRRLQTVVLVLDLLYIRENGTIFVLFVTKHEVNNIVAEAYHG